MTVFNRVPQNTNALQPTKYLLTFDRIGSIQYFCQSVNIPGISVGEASVPFPSLNIPLPGNKLSFNNFNINFIIDEQMDSWKSLYNWFQSFASPKGTEERNRLTQIQNQNRTTKHPFASDATLSVLSALNNPLFRIQFYNMFPISLSDINLDVKLSADDILTGDAVFVYEQFEFFNA